MNRLGYSVKADLRTCLVHTQTDYVERSLAYHAVVARSRAILRNKWINRNTWRGVDAFNASHGNMIPTIEELTHMTESKLAKFTASYDGHGFKNCFIEPRLGSLAKAANYFSVLNHISETTADEYKFGYTDQGMGFMV